MLLTVLQGTNSSPRPQPENHLPQVSTVLLCLKGPAQ